MAKLERAGLDRRTFLLAVAAAAARPVPGRSAGDESPRSRLGFSLYGMRSLPLTASLEVCAEIGYGCVELPVMADWPADSDTLSESDVSRCRDVLAAQGLRLSALMEHLPLTGSDQEHAARLARLEAALKLARKFDNERPPLVETVLGGSPGQWPQLRDTFVARSRDWAERARRHGVVVALKAHVSGAVHRPDQLIELIAAVDSEWIRAAYDYSHFQVQELELEATLAALLPYTVFIHVKDCQRVEKRVQFLLPGEGSIDYAMYFGLLAKSSYRGDVVVEVSGQLHAHPDYRPRQAAERSFAALASPWQRAGLGTKAQ